MAGALTLPLEKTISLLQVDVQREGVRAGTLHPCPVPPVAVEVDLSQQSPRRGDGKMRNLTTINRQERPYLPAPADNRSAIAHHHPQCHHHLKMKLPTAPPLALAPVPEHATRSGDTSEVPQLRASRRCRHLQLAEPIRPNLGWRLRFKRLRSHHSGSRSSKINRSYFVPTI